MNIPPPNPGPRCWIIALGNVQRGDDGIGPLVARCLRQRIGPCPGVVIETCPTLDPTLMEEVQAADCIVFVDAGLDQQPEDVRWTPVEPVVNGWAMGSHHLSPNVFLGLLQLLYHRCPTAWLISVRGSSFEFTESVTVEACLRAEAAVAQIVDWLALKLNLTEKEDEPWIKETTS